MIKLNMSLQEEFDALFSEIPDSSFISLTFFDIGGYGFYENISSNILMFYFNPKSKYHSFGDLLIKSLLSSINAEDLMNDGIADLVIKREATTETGRIDLILYNKKWVIAIENKIRHNLSGNDLDEYAEFLRKQYPGRKIIKIVLSIKDESKNLKGEFINLTYKKLLEKIEQNFKKITLLPNDKYSLFFYEFIQSLKNMYEPIKMEKEELDFLINNQDKIEKIIELEDKLKRYIEQRAYKISDAIPVAHMERKWVFGGNDVGFHYIYNDTSYKLECVIEKSGIIITICVENNKIDLVELEKLDLFKKKKGIFKLTPNPENTRIIIEENIPFVINDEYLIDKLKQILELIKITETTGDE